MNLVGAREFHVAACLTSEVRVRVVLKEEDERIEMSSYGSFSFTFLLLVVLRSPLSSSHIPSRRSMYSTISTSRSGEHEQFRFQKVFPLITQR